ncbi:hypothetical protein [Kitasatospora sp. NPDC057223]|uniref:hypothetical protein n=1 Tax=Kitasatospora sp. NPDC057223 TaxID=3346055 RepID=UPI0036274A37
MPPIADLLTHRDHRDHRAAQSAASPAPRRRRRAEPNPFASAALQRALDRRDNGGATGHLG